MVITVSRKDPTQNHCGELNEHSEDQGFATVHC